MTNLTEDNLTDFFNRAFRVLGQTPEKIKRRFPKATFNFVNFRKHLVLEATTTDFTISCLINSYNRCEIVYIFINKDDEAGLILQMISYCNRTFPYSYFLKSWLSENYSIDLKVINESVLVVISKVKPLSDKLQKYLVSKEI